VSMVAALSEATDRIGRRPYSFFDRAAMVGAAFAAVPLRYILRRGSAPEALRCTGTRTPDLCANGTCKSTHCCCPATDGWTAFCCQLTGWGSNSGCPPYAFIGGWWRCSALIQTGFCGLDHDSNGRRYYLDCNANTDASCQCTCAAGKCQKRKTCCNCFRYGQCNTQIPGTTWVVCRLLSCVKPSYVGLDCANCNGTDAKDDDTCCHPDQTPCLDGELGCANCA
jgi:hypothetical protein